MNDATKAKLTELKDKVLALLAKPTTYKVVVIVGVVAFLAGAILF